LSTSMIVDSGPNSVIHQYPVTLSRLYHISFHHIFGRFNEYISAMASWDLPALRSVTVSKMKPRYIDFFEKHGSKISSLSIRPDTTDPVSHYSPILRLCPNLQDLIFTHWGQYLPVSPYEHSKCLRRIGVATAFSSMNAEPAFSWRPLRETFKALRGYAGLRCIQFVSLLDNECEIIDGGEDEAQRFWIEQVDYWNNVGVDLVDSRGRNIRVKRIGRDGSVVGVPAVPEICHC